MLATTWSQTLLDGAIPAISIVVGTAVAHRVSKWRQGKKTHDTAAVEAAIDARIAPLESDLEEIRAGLFGVRTPFGQREGFVHEVRRELQQQGEALRTLVSEATTNGGSSMKDDLRAVREHLERDDD